MKLRTPRRRAACVAFHAGAVAHQGEVAALAAGFAFVAFGARLGAFFGCGRLGVCAGVGPGEMLERLRRREFWLGLGFERRAAGGFATGIGGVERGDIGGAPTRRAARAALPTKGGG